jgi:predicted RNA-binding Zn ribbon-like protein
MEAPPELRPLIDVLNSRRMDWRADQLDDAGATSVMLRDSALAPHGSPVGAPDWASTVSALRVVRDALVEIVAEPDPDDRDRAWRTINEVAERVRLSVRLHASADGPTAELEPARDALPGEVILARLLTRLHDAVRAGSLRRIRLCANPGCAVAFYDRTRSRTQRWHSYSVCGNPSNVAAYRARTRKPGPKSPYAGPRSP